jgi:hypothetical protein
MKRKPRLPLFGLSALLLPLLGLATARVAVVGLAGAFARSR